MGSNFYPMNDCNDFISLQMSCKMSFRKQLLFTAIPHAYIEKPLELSYEQCDELDTII